MIGAGKEHQSFGLGGGGGQLRQLCCGCELIMVSAQEKFWNAAGMQRWVSETLVLGLGRQAECDECADVGSGLTAAATGHNSHGRTKAEANGNHRAFVFVFKPCESGKHIGGLRLPVMRTLAQAGAAKVEAQHWEAKSPRRIVEGLHGVVDNFVVKITAAQGMRMTDQCGERCIGSAFVDHGFESACWSGQKHAPKCRTRLT